MPTVALAGKRSVAEDERLKTVELYSSIDTRTVVEMSDIVELAADICGAPVAIVNLVGDGWQWFKAEVGLGITGMPIEHTLQRPAMLEQDLVIIGDASFDSRLDGNPLTKQLGLRSFAGATLRTQNGEAIGTLCVLDYVPRDFEPRQGDALRKLARQAMSQLEHRRAAALTAGLDPRSAVVAEEAPVMLWATDVAGECVYLNSRWHKHTGRSGVSDAATHGWIVATHPDDYEKTLTAFLQANARTEPFRVEYRLRDAQGTYRWALNVATPRFETDGRFLGYVGSVLDIDEIHRTFAEIRERNRALEGEIAGAVADRDRTEGQLRQSQKVEAIGQLTGSVAHDFNNLLTVVGGAVEMLRRPDLSGERQRAYVEAIGATVERAAKLTGRLLAFARREESEPETFEVGASVDGLVEMLTILLGTSVGLSVRPYSEECYVLADPGLFDMALVNLAINARDAMEGHGTLGIEIARASTIPANRSRDAVWGRFITIAVTDTGAGIPPERVERIFEPFYTTKAVGAGTGLGLSQVFDFVRKSGGDVIVESKVGLGTTFTLYLPCSPENQWSETGAGMEP